MVATSGTPKARALAAALRRMRQEAGISVREMARRLDLPHSVISYWETGKRIPRPADAGSYLAALGASSAERERVLNLLHGIHEPNWLAAGIRGMNEHLNGLLECERTAIGIVEWSPLVVPGLLQTADYAKAIFGAGDALSPLDVEASALLRSGRRKMFDRADPTQLHALIGEPALRGLVGGKATLLHQLRHLRRITTDSEPITVQIVRTAIPWHPGLAGPFVLYEFADTPAIVHLEHHRSPAFLYDENDVDEYIRVAGLLRDETALSPQDSRKLIDSIIEELEKT